MASSRTCASSDGQHVTSQHVTSQHVVNSRHRGMHADVHGSIEVRRVCTNAQAPCSTSAAPSGRSTQVRQPHPIVCILGPTALCDAGEPLCPPWCSSREPTHLRSVLKAIDSGETVIPVPPCKRHQRRLCRQKTGITEYRLERTTRAEQSITEKNGFTARMV